MNRLLALLLVLSITLLAACGTTDAFTDFNEAELNTQTTYHLQLRDATIQGFDTATEWRFRLSGGSSNLTKGLPEASDFDTGLDNNLDLITHENLHQWSVDLDAKGHVVETQDSLAFKGKGTATFKNGETQIEVEVSVRSSGFSDPASGGLGFVDIVW